MLEGEQTYRDGAMLILIPRAISDQDRVVGRRMGVHSIRRGAADLCGVNCIDGSSCVRFRIIGIKCYSLQFCLLTRKLVMLADDTHSGQKSKSQGFVRLPCAMLFRDLPPSTLCLSSDTL